MAEVGEIYPGTNERIVAKIKNPNGPGYWLQGEMGGVFAEEGAPFLGSYMGESAATRNDPNRRFTGIVAEGTGYRSITANPNERGYGYFAPAQNGQQAAQQGGPPASTATTPPTGPTPSQQSAIALINRNLSNLGLPASLGQWAWEQIQQGVDPTQVMMNLEQRPEFQQRFPAIQALRQRQQGGEAVYVPSPAEYVDYEKTVSAQMRAAGLPAGFYDQPSDFTNFIVGQVSPAEIGQRIEGAKVAAYQSPAEFRMAFDRLYGDEGDLIAQWLDPSKALPHIQAKSDAARIAGTAERVGYGLLTREEAERLGSVGVSDAEAQQGFTTLTMEQGLYANTAEESAAGEQFTRGEQIGLLEGDAAALAERDRRRQRRQANFQGGGGAASGGGGRTGLG